MNAKRNVYLEMRSIQEAKEILFGHFGGKLTQPEKIDVAAAKDRVLTSRF